MPSNSSTGELPIRSMHNRASYYFNLGAIVGGANYSKQNGIMFLLGIGIILYFCETEK